MTIHFAGDKIASVADVGRCSRDLADRRRGGGTTGGQQEIFPKINENSIENHAVIGWKKLLTNAKRYDSLYRLSPEADREESIKDRKSKKVLDKVRLALIEYRSCRLKRTTGTLITEQ